MPISVKNKTYSLFINNKYEQNSGYYISLRKPQTPTRKIILKNQAKQNFKFSYTFHWLY